LTNGHPHITAPDAVRLVGETLYHYPCYSRILPSYGTEEARKIMKKALASSDYAVRAEAAEWLYRSVLPQPSAAQEVLALCQASYQPEEQAADVEVQRNLRRIRHVIDALQSRDWKHEDKGIMTESEFLSLRELSCEELLALISAGGDRATYACSVLFADGCTDELVDRLVEISRTVSGPAGTTAALAMAQAGLKVAVCERGEQPGAKNMFGGILYNTEILEKVLPGFWKLYHALSGRVVPDHREYGFGIKIPDATKEYASPV